MKAGAKLTASLITVPLKLTVTLWPCPTAEDRCSTTIPSVPSTSGIDPCVRTAPSTFTVKSDVVSAPCPPTDPVKRTSTLLPSSLVNASATCGGVVSGVLLVTGSNRKSAVRSPSAFWSPPLAGARYATAMFSPRAIACRSVSVTARSATATDCGLCTAPLPCRV